MQTPSPTFSWVRGRGVLRIGGCSKSRKYYKSQFSFKAVKRLRFTQNAVAKLQGHASRSCRKLCSFRKIYPGPRLEPRTVKVFLGKLLHYWNCQKSTYTMMLAARCMTSDSSMAWDSDGRFKLQISRQIPKGGEIFLQWKKFLSSKLQSCGYKAKLLASIFWLSGFYLLFLALLSDIGNSWQCFLPVRSPLSAVMLSFHSAGCFHTK